MMDGYVDSLESYTWDAFSYEIGNEDAIHWRTRALRAEARERALEELLRTVRSHPQKTPRKSSVTWGHLGELEA